MRIQRGTMVIGLLIAATIGLLAQGGFRAAAADARDPNDRGDVEFLTRGPVHEAFAEANSYEPALDVVVPLEPPAAIDEFPPDEKPEGEALWIPGYWQWDNERDDYIWVSGLWRIPPPGCSWVPGYWVAVADGWTWTPGFWMTSEEEEIDYLPQPPRSLEVGPSSPPPAPDYIWAPGCWLWIRADHGWRPWTRSPAHYAWRPGYWVQARPDWVWSPAYYVHTPHGMVYVDGYWDRTIERRGVLFAPAYIRRSVRERPHYIYSPSIVIQLNLVTDHLFISLNSGHYYFGDYYDADYSRRGIYPWFEYHNRHHGYDPIYAHERWRRSRTDARWEEQVRENHDFRVKHADARPPRDYSAQAAYAARAPEGERKSRLLAAPLAEVARRGDAPIRYERITEDRRKSLGAQGKDLAKFRDQRAQWESPDRQTDKARSAPTVRNEPRQSQASPTERSSEPREVQRGRPSKEPVEAQPDRATREPARVQPDRTQKKPAEVQPDQAPREPVRDRPDRTRKKPVEVQPDQAPKEPARVEQDRTQRKPIEAQPDRAPKKPAEVQQDRTQKKPAEVQPDQGAKRQVEAPAAESPKRERTTNETPRITKERKERIPRSPVVGTRIDTPDRGANPPSKPSAPKPDRTIRPKATEDGNRKPEAVRATEPSAGRGRGQGR